MAGHGTEAGRAQDLKGNASAAAACPGAPVPGGAGSRLGNEAAGTAEAAARSSAEQHPGISSSQEREAEVRWHGSERLQRLVFIGVDLAKVSTGEGSERAGYL
jgi:hypothetical protein